jgi:hypothetical protein
MHFRSGINVNGVVLPISSSAEGNSAIGDLEERSGLSNATVVDPSGRQELNRDLGISQAVGTDDQSRYKRGT